MLLVLEGDANDYVGKGLSGGVLAVRPPARASVPKASDNVIVGNTCLYGATAGRRSSPAGPASASPCATAAPWRSSRAWATTACEYMTGGDGGGARHDGPQLRRRDERRRGLRARRRSRRSAARLQQGDRGRSSRSTPRTSKTLRGLVEEHVAHTRSAHGRSLLATWGKRRFVKVMPHEWRRRCSQLRRGELSRWAIRRAF